MQNKFLLICLLTALALGTKAQTQEPDSIQVATTDSVPKKKLNIIQKLLNYYSDANKEKKDKKFDFSIIGGPHFASDTKLGLGL